MPSYLYTGPASSPSILLLQFCPSREDSFSSRHFSDAAGNVVKTLLSRYQIHSSQLGLCSLFSKHLNDKDLADLYQPNNPKPHSATEELHHLLNRIRPNIVVVLGKETFSIFKPGCSVQDHRGSLYQTSYGQKFLGTFHPKDVFISYEDFPIFQLDLRRAVEESKTRDLKLDLFNFILRPTLSQVLSYLKRPSKFVTADIETAGIDQIRCLGLSLDGKTAISIPFICDPNQRPSLISDTLDLSSSPNNSSYWSVEEEKQIHLALFEFFSNPETRVVFQNLPFDLPLLQSNFGYVFANVYFDTLIAQHTCYCELPKGLDFLASIYTRIPYYSSYNRNSDIETWTYNSYDVVATWQVAEKLHKELEDFGLTEYYFNHAHEAALTYTRAQSRGVAINMEERERQSQLINQEITLLEEKIRHYVGDPNFNPASPKQISVFLYQKLKLPPILHRKTKNVTTDKIALIKLAEKHPEHSEFFSCLKKHSSLDTIRSSFFKLKLPKGRIYTGFNPAGTVTGRLASSAVFYRPDDSTNLQNIPRPDKGSIRRCFTADPGMVLIKADLSQAEFRIVVWLARIERLIKIYTESSNFDIHRWVASLIFKILEENVQKTQRDVAKNGVYGGNYMMHYKTAAITYNLKIELAKWVLDKYHEVIPEIPLWWNDFRKKLFATRVYTNPYGYRRHFFSRPDDSMLRSALSHSAQSLVGCLINRAAILVDNLTEYQDTQILLQVHDELVLQTRKELVLPTSQLLKTVMEYPVHFPDVVPPLIIPADVSVGPNWQDTEKLKCLS